MSWQKMETAAFVVLLTIVGLRPLIAEQFSTGTMPIDLSNQGIGDPWAATTLVLDSVILLIGAAMAFRWLAAPNVRYRLTGLEMGGLLFAMVALASSALAAEKRPAINASIDWMASIVLCISLVQSLRTPARLRLAVVVIVAAACANGLEVANQHFYTLKESVADYREHREEFWGRQNVPLDAPQVRAFEQRLESREPAGYFTHSNVTAAYTLLGLFAAVGLGLSSRRDDEGGGLNWASLIGLGMVGMALGGIVFLTTSLGSLAAAAVGLGLLVAWSVLRGRVKLSHGRGFAVGWIAVAALTLGVVVFGVVRGGLPGASLDFRWQYWTASTQMVVDHPLLGVGAENFGDYYLRYKSIASPEEVANPHNFVVNIATEYGIAGLLAIGLLIFGAAWNASQPVKSVFVQEPVPAEQAAPSWKWFALLTALVFLVRAPLIPVNDLNYVYLQTMMPLLAWAGAGVIALYLIHTNWTEASARNLGLAANVALIAFLLQDTINFALFVPGARTTFFALLAVSLACRPKEMAVWLEGRPVKRLPDAGIAAAGAAFAIFVALSITPPLRSEWALRHARDLARHEPILQGKVMAHPANTWYEKAAGYDQLDPTPLAEHARWLEAVAELDPRPAEVYLMAVEKLKTAIERSPARGALYRREARLHSMLAPLTGNPAQAVAAIDLMKEAIELYPTRPLSYVELGDCLLTRLTIKDTEEAIEAYRYALSLDDRRPDWETTQNFSADTRAVIHERIENATQVMRELLALPDDTDEEEENLPQS